MRPGESIYHNKRVKTITSLPKNTDGKTFIIWESYKPNYQMGGCLISTWKEWIEEEKEESKTIKEQSMYLVKKNKRRGVTSARYY
jgi:hypothetical protein